MKYIVSDLDGTIIFKGVGIKEKDRAAIHKYKKEGNIFIAATGRNLIGFKRGVKKYSLDFWDYAILSNGSIIIDNNYNAIFYR